MKAWANKVFFWNIDMSKLVVSSLLKMGLVLENLLLSLRSSTTSVYVHLLSSLTLEKLIAGFISYQALIDGAKTSGVPRQGISYAHVTLTPILIAKLPRGARSGTVEKYWKDAAVDNQWRASSWAKKIAAREARRQLSDFDRFKVMVLRKQRRYQVRKAFAKTRKDAK